MRSKASKVKASVVVVPPSVVALESRAPRGEYVYVEVPSLMRRLRSSYVASLVPTFVRLLALSQPYCVVVVPLVQVLKRPSWSYV
jgi:hypothetical protein